MRNLRTALKTRPSTMADYDRQPPPLRAWLAGAVLPWSARSASRIWLRALRETGCPSAALSRLQAAEARSLQRDRFTG
jgi:hypothetical protein